ncbi:MAG: uncharacterized protein QOJ53_1671 [Sphingomonadales bacterium]|jgi:uncharacterized protein (DUF2062 family)|nr:uncharacterized protein [Sphingomonadales bacterium]MEA3047339.1 uncharacterized protein [Sphingomonadales bacterium]
MADPGQKSWLDRWVANNMPSREQMAQSRWIKPFGQRILHSEFWRFTRRSVPRGVAMGLFVGVFFLIPGVQIIGAALFCIPVRGNIPIAAGMTFLTNPFTTPFLIVASIPVGNLFGFHADKAAIMDLYARSAPVGDWLAWLASDAAPALILGLFVVGVVSGVIGYFISVVVWRWWVGRKWRRRAARMARAD